MAEQKLRHNPYEVLLRNIGSNNAANAQFYINLRIDVIDRDIGFQITIHWS